MRQQATREDVPQGVAPREASAFRVRPRLVGLRSYAPSRQTVPTAAPAYPEGIDDVLVRPIIRASPSLRFGHLFEQRRWLRTRFAVDVLTLYLASISALAASSNLGASGSWLAVAFPALTLGILYSRRNPDERLHGSAIDTSVYVLGGVSLAAMLTLAGASIFGDHQHLTSIALHLWLFTLGYLVIARVVLLALRGRAVRKSTIATPTLIVGAGVIGDQLVRRLSEDPSYGLRPVGFLDADPLPRSAELGPPSVPILGGLTDLAEAIRRTEARHVILAFSSEPDSTLVGKIRECQELGVEVAMVPRLYESISERSTLDFVGGLPLVSLRPIDPRGWQFSLKHTLDRVMAASALLVLAPVMLLVAIAVRMASPGPVLFRQRRVGRDGRVFDVLKFRTMYECDHTERFDPPEGCAPGGVEGEDRRTPIGAWLRNTSLDELPQLINVLRGEMSLVGPRPERPEFVSRFAAEVRRYDDRHRVKSGITGWAQVSGFRGQTPIADRVEWDNHYIQNWSLRMDLRIIAMTLVEVLHLRG